MTIDDFLRKYTRCPFCESYTEQGSLCDGCKYRFHGADGIDKFMPTPEWTARMNREVTEP